MNTTEFTVIFVFCYLIALFLITQRSNGNVKQDFIIGSRKIGIIPTAGSVAAGLRDGAGIVFWIGSAFTIGYGGIWVIIGAISGLFIMTLFSPLLRKHSIENNYVTAGQMIKDAIGPLSEKGISFLIIFFCFTVVSMQFYVLGNIVSGIFHIPSWVSVFVAAVTIGFYSFLGGYGAVVRTDTIQFFLIIFLIFFIPTLEINIKEASSIYTMISAGWGVSISFYLIGLFYVLSSGDIWQRIFSAKNDRVVKLGLPLGGLFLLIMTFSLILIGFASKEFIEDGDLNDILFYIYNYDVFPPYLLAYIALVVIAITMSTIDTLVYLFSSTLLSNFFKNNTSDKYIKNNRIITILMLLTTCFISLGIENVVKFLFKMAPLMYIIAPIFLFTGFGLFKNNDTTDYRIIFTMILSTLVYLLLLFYNLFDNLIFVPIPGIISFILCILVLLVGKMSEIKANKRR